MSFGETILVIGALVILSVVSLFLNEGILEGSWTLTESQVLAGAVSIGASAVEKAKSLKFDEAVVQDSTLFNPALLTDAVNFGPEAGETPQTFDDIDDIHNFTDSTHILPVQYTVITRVAYFDTAAMSITVSQKSFYKHITVLVYTPFLRDTVRLQYVISNWKQR
jgi:hypothetical protein